MSSVSFSYQRLAKKLPQWQCIWSPAYQLPKVSCRVRFGTVVSTLVFSTCHQCWFRYGWCIQTLHHTITNQRLVNSTGLQDPQLWSFCRNNQGKLPVNGTFDVFNAHPQSYISCGSWGCKHPLLKALALGEPTTCYPRNRLMSYAATHGIVSNTPTYWSLCCFWNMD